MRNKVVTKTRVGNAIITAKFSFAECPHVHLPCPNRKVWAMVNILLTFQAFRVIDHDRREGILMSLFLNNAGLDSQKEVPYD